MIVNILEVFVELERCEVEVKLKKQKGSLRKERTQLRIIQDIENNSKENNEIREIEVLNIIIANVDIK